MQPRKGMLDQVEMAAICQNKPTGSGRGHRVARFGVSKVRVTSRGWPGTAPTPQAVASNTSRFTRVTWDHRGLGGSNRPSDESRITMSDHGIDRAVVIGWSAGVKAALRDQRRIVGVLAVGGVPGGSFEALLHPLPRFLRPRAGRVGSHLMRYLGPVLNRLGDVMPGSPEHGFDPRGGVGTFGLDLVHGQTLVRVLRQFANHDWPWYSRLARAVGDHPPMDLSAIDMPVTYIAGTWDAVTSAERMQAASAQTPQSRYVELPATHFVPLQLPHRVSTELDSLVERCHL